MKENLVQRFRKFYFALPEDEQRALYDIMSAIRGEDGGGMRVKNYTTARIRGALFGKTTQNFHSGFCFASFKKAKSYDDTLRWLDGVGQDIKTLFSQSKCHFQGHVQSAIKALGKYGFKRTISDLMKFI